MKSFHSLLFCKKLFRNFDFMKPFPPKTTKLTEMFCSTSAKWEHPCPWGSCGFLVTNHENHSSDLHPITPLWLMCLQGLRCGRIIMLHFPLILLKVLDSCRAPFSCLNYVQLFSAEAPLCCSWLLNRCSAALV